MTAHRARRRPPNGPLVLETHELGRRPGSIRHVVTSVAAPADLGTEMLGVPAGASLSLDLRLESVMEGILVSGTVVAPLIGECARCLEEISDTATVELRELFYYPERADPTDEDSEAGVVTDDQIDIEPAVRDAIVLSLPLSPTCRPDCAGLCVDCGARLDDVGPDHAHPQVDPRWAALSALAGSIPTEAASTESASTSASTENKEKN